MMYVTRYNNEVLLNVLPDVEKYALNILLSVYFHSKDYPQKYPSLFTYYLLLYLYPNIRPKILTICIVLQYFKNCYCVSIKSIL